MASPGQQKININQSNDSGDYVVGFHHQALTLIIVACDILKATGADYTNTEEPEITGEVVHYARQYIDTQNNHGWAWRYTVHDDPPENTGGRKGKDRKKVDIIIERAQRGKHPRIRFEAKRLKRPDFTVGIYVGKEGLGEFISGNYAPECDTAGMLGYIQSDDCDYWAEQIPVALSKKKTEVHLTKDGQWQKADLENVDDCYKTRHNRPTVKGELLVYHLLLDFVR